MTLNAPVADLDSRFSSPGAAATSWTQAEAEMANAGVFWLSTVRPEGRPHVAPLIAIWLDHALYFCTGETERKARNLTANAQVTITTGCNTFSEGLDLVVEGHAVLVNDEARLHRLAEAFVAKYGEYWRLPGREGVLTFEVTPTTAFGFGRGSADGPPPQGGFSQTRWRFRAVPSTTGRR